MWLTAAQPDDGWAWPGPYSDEAAGYEPPDTWCPWCDSEHCEVVTAILGYYAWGRD